MKKIVSLLLTAIILISIVSISAVPIAAASSLYNGKTVSEVLGMDPNVYLKWLSDHENNNYYLGTPYGDGDYRNPNGDCSGENGYSDTAGEAAMNCTGFVWHVLYKATKASGGKTSIIPALGRKYWLDFYENNQSIERCYFSSKSEMLNSGYLSKGDIIWMYVDGEEYTPMDEHHVGIYYGDGHSDVLWHSSDNTGTNVKGNVIAKIRPKEDYNTKYMVLKVGSQPIIKIVKSSDSPATTNGNSNYSFKGIKYCFYKSKGNYTANDSNPDYIGYIELDKDGVGYSTSGSRAALREIKPGTYYVREYNDATLKASGYEYNDTVYTVKVTKNDVLDNPVVVRVSDTPVKPPIKIVKSSTNPELTDGNSNYSFDGIAYCVYKSRKSWVTGDANPDYLGYIRLDENGEGYSYEGSRFALRNLGIGTYYIKEDNDAARKSSGYKLDETVYTVNLTRDYSVNNPYILRVKDEPEAVISARIVKKSANPDLTDGNSCYTLQGAKFNLYTTDEDARKDTNPFMTNIETDENGVAYISDLPDPGKSVKTYYVREIVAPKGFALSDKIGELKVSADEEAFNMEEMYDEPQNDPVRILLRKEDEQTGAAGKRLEGAEFTVKYYSDFYTTEEECLSAIPTRTWVISTDSDGYSRLSGDYLISGDEFYYSSEGEVVLPLGTVYIKESKAPIGYKLNANAYIQQITSEGDLDRVDTYNAPVIREPRAGVVNISGVKTWRDDNDRDGKRPESLTIDLLRNDEVVDSYTTDESQNWHFEFNDLPEGYGDLLADDEIYYYTYSVKESSISGYTSTGGDLVEVSSTTDEWNVTTHNYEVEFINTYTPDKIKLEGKKVWNDYDDAFGFRPGEVTITLLMNGTPYRTVKTDASQKWKFSFDNLNRYYDHGEPIHYSVLETDVDHYTSSISSNVVPGESIPYFSVVNQLKTGVVTLNKTDENGQPLANVKFKLYRESNDKLITCSLFDDTYAFDPDGTDNEFITDADGLIRIEGLPVGDYVFVELETVEGYMPYPDPIPFSLIEEDDVISRQLVSVSNHRAVMYNTGGVGNTVFYVIAIGTAVAAAAIILAVMISKKRKKKKQD